MNLVELMVGMVIFAFLSIGITTSLLQQRKYSENAMSTVIAQSMAEGILEQIRRTGFATLSDFSQYQATAPDDCPVAGTETATNPALYTTYRSVEIKFIGVGANNYATVQDFNLYWMANADTYQEVGERTDPDDLTSPIIGVVLDVDYKNSSNNLVRQRRYMKMRVNITRSMNTQKSAVMITLRYQWAIPERRTAAGLPIYFPVREIHTVISKISTY